jgi:hypothetical protein
LRLEYLLYVFHFAFDGSKHYSFPYREPGATFPPLIFLSRSQLYTMLDTPGAFIGEFDALDGPKVTYAFEYFDYSRTAKRSSAVRKLLLYVEGTVLLGKSVASGFLHHECKEYLNSVAAHVLTSNESREERLLYQESGCPCVGSFLFSIPDIVARGEKRRFCLIFLHPSYHELVARWDFLSSFVEVLLKRWTQRATMRYQNEYDTLKNLEQLREELRRKPLRTLLQLLADAGADTADSAAASPSSSAVFEDFHCCFEIILPQVFSQVALLRSSERDAAHREVEHLLDDNVLLAQSSIDRVDVDPAHMLQDDVVLPRFAKQVVLANAEIAVKPLPVWLLEYLCDTAAQSADVAPQQAVHRMLRALFSGNQIVITGEDARDCASLGMALSCMLPPPLVKMHLGSDRYRMPYESRVLSFSQRALEIHTFADTPEASGEADVPHAIKLFDMEADGVVHVRLADGRIHYIQDCDTLRCAATQKEHRRQEELQAPSSPTTLENRIITLLKPYLVPIAGRCAISILSLQLVTTQLHQLVSEYVVRGHVYLQLFAKQEVETNSHSLSPVPTHSEAGGLLLSASAEKSSLRPQKTVSPRNPSQNEPQHGGALRPSSQVDGQDDESGLPGPNRVGSTETLSSPQSAHGVRITKHARLSPVYGKQFQHNHYVFSSFAPEDHAILMFLGSA